MVPVLAQISPDLHAARMGRPPADVGRCPLNVDIPPLPRESFDRPQLPPFNHTRRISHRYPLNGRTNPNFFSPLEASDDGWAGAIYASQHPASCEKASFLLYEDDLKGQGLGYSIFFHVMALLREHLHT